MPTVSRPKGTSRSQGPDLNATVAAEECHKAVALLIDKLDRMLRRRARYFKVRRHQVNRVEWSEAELSESV